MTEHRIIFGDALTALKTLPDNSVDCCCTSPPYWRLRDYGVEKQIGLEKTPEKYVENIINVFTEVRRVLKPTGTLWLVIGDGYSTSKCGKLKNKDLVGIPWRVALALQEDGWYLRNDIIFSKRNPKPQSASDRFSSTHEHIFLLSKCPNYWFDLDKVRVPHYKSEETKSKIELEDYHPLGKNPGDVWSFITESNHYAHFASFPLALVETILLAGCPPKICSACGLPYEHKIEIKQLNPHEKYTGQAMYDYESAKAEDPSDVKRRALLAMARIAKDLGYHPSCNHNSYIPGTVLDPFLGSATTTQAARKLRRRSIGIELNTTYETSMRERLGLTEGRLLSEEEITFEYL